MSILRTILVPTTVLLVLLLAGTPALAGPAADARSAASQARWADAADAWTRVLKKTPSDREAALGLARAVTEGDLVDLYVGSEDALQTVLEKMEDDRDVRLALGELFLTQARSTTGQQAMKWKYEDAKEQFGRLLEADPTDEDAAVGLARAHYWTAFFSDALEILDDFLSRTDSRGPALSWKGQILYIKALDAYRIAGAVDDEARKLFQQAREAYEAATKADPALFDAWMQLGYTAQYLGEMESALAAYEKAMDLDGESLMPLKGIEAIYAHRPDEYVDVLQTLAKAHPENRAVFFFQGFRQIWQKDYDAAVESLTKYVKTSKTPGIAWRFLGQALDGKGEPEKAKEAFTKALVANPGDDAAAAALDARLLKEHRDTSRQTPEAARAVPVAYAGLFRLAPKNPWVRNNAAYLLRQALDTARRSDGPWEPVLDDCIRIYTEASRLAEEQLRGRETTLPKEKLWDYAGVINDTGLMFQYYASRRDLEKAEEYYLRSLELTNDAYADAFGNLVVIYQEQKRWQEAYDLARDCVDVVSNANGTAHPENRRIAREVMERLVREGKAQED